MSITYSKHHHAHIVELSSVDEESLGGVLEYVSSYHSGEVVKIVHYYDALLIDDVRNIFQSQIHKNKSDETRLIVLGFSSVNVQAQNALLKVLEEPTEGTYFVLCVPSKSMLLPTVCSRCIVVPYVDSQVEESSISFLKLSARERLEKVAGILSEGAQIHRFCKHLELEIGAYFSAGGKKDSSFNRFLELRGELVKNPQHAKYILEELALTLPVTN